MPPLETIRAKMRPPLSPIPPDLSRRIEENRRREQQRIATYGEIRPPIHVPDYHDYRLVAVRGRLYFDKSWRFFTDFLFDYGPGMLGKEWIEEQKTLPPAEQHPLFIWRRQAYEFMQRQTRLPDGRFAAIPNGAMAACNNFYYDLYTVDDNSLLDVALLARLRNREQFQGALHELFCEATCLRAGFTIVREQNIDATMKRTEFMAVHKTTGQHVLVEAKSRHRAGVLAMDGQRRPTDIRFRRLINDAVAKDPNNPLALFVDTNLPLDKAYPFYTPQSRDPIVPSRAMAKLMEKVRSDYGGIDPFNLLAFSNHPQHYSDDQSAAPGNHWAGFISQRTRVPVQHQQALFDLLKAINLYGNVPTEFPSKN